MCVFYSSLAIAQLTSIFSMATSNLHRCTMCPFFSCKQDDLVNHVVRRHQHDSNFIVHCSGIACGLSFRNFHSFKRHVERHHRECVNDESTSMSNTVDDLASVCVDTSDSVPCSESTAEAAYILALKAKHRLSQNAIKDVCESTKELFRTKVTQLSSSSTDCEFTETVVDSLFNGLDTHYKQEQFFKKHFGYVTPCAHEMVSSLCSTADGESVTKHHYGYYVPLKNQLHALLSMPEVQQVFDNVNSCDLIYDFCDADYLRHHSLQSTSSTLNLCLYTDDFEIANPIGVHRKKHKITAFYWLLLNIPPEYRSKLSAIQLLAIARTADIRKCGVNGLLQDFKSTIFELHDGIMFSIDGYGDKTYRGFLVCVLADTPAAQLLGGFKEGVGLAVSPCRSCDVKRNCLTQVTTPAECPMRDIEEHQSRLSYLSSQNKRGYIYWSKRWGINGLSILSDIPGFDVTKCILHDPMHVILEGVGKAELQKMLNVFVFQKKYFTISLLNRRVQKYTYTDTELRDKPVIIDRKALEPKSVFPQTAAAMKNLLMNLPFIVSDLVPEDDEYWQNFILLLRILALSLSPVISVNTPDVLEFLIAKHNKNFVLLYSEDSFTPKFHYLVHFSHQMRLFGPLRNQWCMRFESKNGFFKLHKWLNYRNLPKSLSFHHQRWMCMQMIQSTGCRSNVYLYSGDQVTNGKVVAINTLPGVKEFFGDEQFPEYVMCSERVTVNGLTYNQGTVLVQSIANEVMFVKVMHIFIYEHAKYLVCNKLNVQHFDTHRNAFVTEECDEYCVLRTADLCYKWPQLTHGSFVMMNNVDDVWML